MAKAEHALGLQGRFRWTVLLNAVLLVGFLAEVSVAQEPAKKPPVEFVERVGELEFSGLMIVRPMQQQQLIARGGNLQSAEAIRTRASARLQEYLFKYVPETDELIVTVPPGQTENSFSQMLMATGDYQYAEPDWICFPTNRVPNDPSYWQQWHHDRVRSELAWDLTTGSSNMVVAIVDSGIQIDHSDLAGALVSGYNSDDDLAQSAGGDVSDVDGHGTFVAGLAGAIGDNGIHVVGMGWNFSIMPIRYYNQPGGGYLHNIHEGVRWAAEHGAQCISVSQTGVEYSSNQTTGAYVKGLGSLLFWAAGNDQRDLYWFDWDDVIVVGGTDPNDDKASFSAYGLAVDVYAPATNIYSTGLPGGLAIGNGTSASAPMATGLGALIWSHRPNLTPDEVEQCLFAGCTDLGPAGEDDYWGWGRIDSPNSLLAAGVASITANGIDSDKIVVVQGDNLKIEVNLNPGIFEGVSADWWVLSNTPTGWYRYDLSNWNPGIGVTHQGALSDLSPTTVLDWSGLAKGNYQFYFGVDNEMNGGVDMDSMIYDTVEVIVW
jgi:subtilisin family serine protease